jgi:hypothetical protein
MTFQFSGKLTYSGLDLDLMLSNYNSRYERKLRLRRRRMNEG